MPLPLDPTRAALVLGIALGIALGCAGRRSGERPPPDAPFTVVVENRYRSDVRVFVLHDGQTTRVGMVPLADRGRFVLPARIIGTSRTIRLVAAPIAEGVRYQSETIGVEAGARVVWLLESDLRRSTVTVH